MILQSTVFASETPIKLGNDEEVDTYIYQEGTTFGPVTKIKELKGMEISESNYDGNWATPKDVFYYQDSKKNLHIVTYKEKQKKLYDLTLDNNNKVISNKEISYKLPIFGAFYAGTDGNLYIISGQENLEENKEKVVICVEKYDSNWNKLGNVDIKGKPTNESAGIQIPFNSGTCNVTEYQNYLIIHTSRRMFLAYDGLNHQSDISFIIDTQNMQLLSDLAIPYVSHSFNQFVSTDDTGAAYYLNQGDGYPRALIIEKITPFYASSQITRRSRKHIWELNALQEIGENITFCDVTGFEQMGDNLITVGRSLPQEGRTDEQGREYVAKNIFLIVTDKNLQSSKFQWMTSYDPTLGRKAAYDPAFDLAFYHLFYSDVYFEEDGFDALFESISFVSEPRLIKINGERSVLLYDTHEKNGEYTLCYRELDNNGAVVMSQNYKGISLRTNSQPFFDGKNIVWVGVQYKDRYQEKPDVSLYKIPYGGVNDTSVEVKESAVTLKEGSSKQLTLTTDSVEDKNNVVWTSSDSSVVRVKDGKLTALSKGQAVITAQMGKEKDLCTVTVNALKSNKKLNNPKLNVIQNQNNEINTATLSWKKVTGAEGYTIYVKTGKQKVYKKLATISSGKNSYLHKNLKFGETYSYKIRAYGTKTNGTKRHSSWTTVKKKNTYVPVPKNIKVVPVAEGVDISWDKVEGVDGYIIQGVDSKLYKNLSVNTTSLLDTSFWKEPSKGWQGEYNDPWYIFQSYKVLNGKKYYSEDADDIIPDCMQVPINYLDWIGDKLWKK